MNGGPYPIPSVMSFTDSTNSACDLRVPHKAVLAALLSGSVSEGMAAKWMEENFLEVERWVRFARLNSCFGSSLPQSGCIQVYNGPVDSFSLGGTVDGSTWTSTSVNAQARIWVQNNTGSSGLVELSGAFYSNGSTLSSSSNLIQMTLADGEGILLADHCTIEASSGMAYQVTNLGAVNADITVNVTFTEVDAAGACCAGVE